MNGKGKCKILKDIRRTIAEENDIAYVTSDCKYQGECSGTCPKCEAEVRYLEEELAKRQKAGKAIAVAGIAAALLVGSTGCGINDLFITPHGGDPVSPPESQAQSSENTENTESTATEIPGEIIEETLAGEPVDSIAGVPPMPTEETLELMGDMPLSYDGND